MKYWIPILVLLTVCIPCSNGVPPVTLDGVLFDQFARLTTPPSILFHIWPFLHLLFPLRIL